MSSAPASIGPQDAPAATAAPGAAATPTVSSASLEYFNCASPDDPRVFQRVPYGKREHWLVQWNETDNVRAPSALTAAYAS